MFPSGHARNSDCNLKNILEHKFTQLSKIALQSNATQQNINNMIHQVSNLRTKSKDEINNLYGNLQYITCYNFFRS